jgi:hypothetical protein
LFAPQGEPGMVIVLKLEKEIQVLMGDNKVGLKSDGMH